MKNSLLPERGSPRNEQIKSLGLFLIIPLMGASLVGYWVVKKIQLNGAPQIIQNCVRQEPCHRIIETKDRLVKAKRSWQFYNLSSANLYNANLYNANFSDANLSDANLSDANLSDANLSDTNLRSAYLISSYLYSSNLRSANLSDANLSSAYLSNANLRSANLSGTKLIDSKNLLPSQIKIACYWEQAIYEGHFDRHKYEWIIDEEANQQYIEQLKQDKASNPQKPVDCSKWAKSK